MLKISIFIMYFLLFLHAYSKILCLFIKFKFVKIAVVNVSLKKKTNNNKIILHRSCVYSNNFNSNLLP